MDHDTPKYDLIGTFYLEFVAKGLASPDTLYWQTSQHLLGLLPLESGSTVLDLCCGEGHLAREMASQGAIVTAIDLSQTNLDHARAKTDPELPIQYEQDDAQTLSTQADGGFDLVVCKMALMDIPDITATFVNVARVLKPGGHFVSALLHQCFETPFTTPFEPVETDEGGAFKHHRVQRYFDEGHWHSGGTGVRGHVGAHHRTLSTYINTLLATGFRLTHIDEPRFTTYEPNSIWRQWHHNVAKILYLSTQHP